MALDRIARLTHDPGMRSRAEIEREVESFVAFATSGHTDEELLWKRQQALVARDDAATVLEVAEGLVAESDPDRREIGLVLVRQAAQLDRKALHETAIAILRDALRAETEVGPLAAAVVGLGQLDDEGSRDAILALAAHPDPAVRQAVAFSAPSVGFDAPAQSILIELSGDADDDVRDWATFGLGALTDADYPELRAALFARVEDVHYETRVEAIFGLARRQDERVRPHLLRELRDPDHPKMLDDAAGYLDSGSGRYFYGNS